jgi:hypothetical protein
LVIKAASASLPLATWSTAAPALRKVRKEGPNPGRYFYGCDTRLREAGIPRVDILPLEAGGSIEMMRQLLARGGRRLTQEQWAWVGAIEQRQSTALYCRLAARVLSTWTSSTPLAQCSLPESVGALIEFILEAVEREFGREWTRVALACLTFSRAGLSDGEMQDVLSLNDERVLNHVFQYSKPEDVRRFPLHVWLRLKGALEGLLVEREGGCAVWYHRQLKETAEAIGRIKRTTSKTIVLCFLGELA